jgi:arabinofuranosyltransferase
VPKIIDPIGLTDALIARLPVKSYEVKIGHFYRQIPRGYIGSRRQNTSKYMPEEMREYYTLLRQIISGDLWSIERLKTILLFQIDYYDAPYKGTKVRPAITEPAPEPTPEPTVQTPLNDQGIP